MKRHNLDKLELKNINFGYDNKNLIFENISFEFQSQQIYCLQGPTGGGKNTLLKILMGLTSITAGQYLINGLDISHASHEEFALYRLNMGMAFDTGGLLNNKSLYENYKLIMDYHDVIDPAHRQNYIFDLLKRFDLFDSKHMRPAFVSSGVQKAAALLKAFLLKPELVILNNPTLGLNPEQRGPLIDIIKEYQESHNLKYIIMATDDVSLIEDLPMTFINVTKNQLEIKQTMNTYKRVV